MYRIVIIGVFILFLVENIEAFRAAPSTPNLSSQRIFLTRTRAFEIPHERDDGDDDGWTLEEDWALMDLVPAFTVGESEETRRTFWTQLCVSSSQLSGRSDEREMLRRYRTLSEGRLLPAAGPSPPILQTWSIGADGHFVGELDGRTVWFASNIVGRLEGDSSPAGALPGGFVEAVGGRVYELGRPRDGGNHEPDAVSVNTAEKEAERKFPSLNGVSETLSALIAATVLSFAVGYGAGMGIISDASRKPNFSSRSIEVSRNVKSMDRTPTVSMIESKRSVSERRAIKEAQVLGEQRRIQTLTRILEKDQMELQQLRLEEQGVPDKLQ